MRVRMALLLGFSSPEYPCARGPVMWWWWLVSWHCHESHVSWELFVTTIVTSVTQKMRQLIVVSRIGVNLLQYAQWWRASLNYNSNIIYDRTKINIISVPGLGGAGDDGASSQLWADTEIYCFLAWPIRRGCSHQLWAGRGLQKPRETEKMIAERDH